MIYFGRKQNGLFLTYYIFILLILLMYKSSLISIVLLSLGFIWNWGIYQKNIYDKVQNNKRYRYSFMKLYSKYGEVLLRNIKSENEIINLIKGLIVPNLIMTCFYLVSHDSNMFYISLGSFCFEIYKLAIKQTL